MFPSSRFDRSSNCKSFSRIVSEEIHGAVIGRAESPLRTHVIGVLTRSVGAFQPTISLLKRTGFTVLAERRAFPHWLVTRLQSYEEAKNEYLRTVLSSDAEARQVMRPVLMFLFLIAEGVPPLMAGLPSALTETTIIALNGGRFPRIAVREGLRRARRTCANDKRAIT